MGQKRTGLIKWIAVTRRLIMSLLEKKREKTCLSKGQEIAEYTFLLLQFLHKTIEKISNFQLGLI